MKCKRATSDTASESVNRTRRQLTTAEKSDMFTPNHSLLETGRVTTNLIAERNYLAKRRGKLEITKIKYRISDHKHHTVKTIKTSTGVWLPRVLTRVSRKCKNRIKNSNSVRTGTGVIMVMSHQIRHFPAESLLRAKKQKLAKNSLIKKIARFKFFFINFWLSQD